MHIVQPRRREGKPGEKEEQGKESRVTDSRGSQQHREICLVHTCAGGEPHVVFFVIFDTFFIFCDYLTQPQSVSSVM